MSKQEGKFLSAWAAAIGQPPEATRVALSDLFQKLMTDPILVMAFVNKNKTDDLDRARKAMAAYLPQKEVAVDLTFDAGAEDSFYPKTAETTADSILDDQDQEMTVDETQEMTVDETQETTETQETEVATPKAPKAPKAEETTKAPKAEKAPKAPKAPKNDLSDYEGTLTAFVLDGTKTEAKNLRGLMVSVCEALVAEGRIAEIPASWVKVDGDFDRKFERKLRGTDVRLYINLSGEQQRVRADRLVRTYGKPVTLIFEDREVQING